MSPWNIGLIPKDQSSELDSRDYSLYSPSEKAIRDSKRAARGANQQRPNYNGCECLADCLFIII